MYYVECVNEILSGRFISITYQVRKCIILELIIEPDWQYSGNPVVYIMFYSHSVINLTIVML